MAVVAHTPARSILQPSSTVEASSGFLGAIMSTASTALAASWSKPQTPSVLDTLPGDILWEIASHLPTQADALHLAQTCSRIMEHVLPFLYRSVTLRTPAQCIPTLAYLARTPSIARHVTTLVVFPDVPKVSSEEPPPSLLPPPPHPDSLAIAAAVRVASRHLDMLQTFVWDSAERPADDAMWFALQTSCKQLRSIGSSIGCDLPPTNSELFNFKNLHGFSLAFKDGFYRAHSDDDELMHPWDDDVPAHELPKLWEMLTVRSSELTTLLLPGCSTLPASIPQLASARWPALHTLVLGDVSVAPPPGSDPFTRPFIDFLTFHSNLQVLHLSSRAGVPGSHLLTLPVGSLPILREFGGTLDQAGALPDTTKSHLRTLRLLEPLYLREVTPLAVSSALSGLPRLRRLSVAAVLHSSYDHGGLLRAVVSACPGLVELEFTAAAKPCFLLETFARAIRPLTKLRTLNLALVRVPGEESDIAGAARLARAASPRLERFTITHLPRGRALPLRLVPSHTPAHAEFLARTSAPTKRLRSPDSAPVEQEDEEPEADQDPDFCPSNDEDEALWDAWDNDFAASSSAPARPRLFDQLGASRASTYDIVRDPHGIPVELSVRRVDAALALPVRFPLLPRVLLPDTLAAYLPAPPSALVLPSPLLALIPTALTAAAASARTTLNLRPPGHPRAPRKAPLELLLHDRTAAGEEARLLAFCVMLASVAACAFLGCDRG